MNRQKARRLIIVTTLVWVILGLVLAGLTFTGFLDKPLFEKLFAGGFVAYAIAMTILSKVMMDDTSPPS